MERKRAQAAGWLASAQPVDRLTSLKKKNGSLINEIMLAIESLKALTIKVKTEGVKDDVEKISDLFQLCI